MFKRLIYPTIIAILMGFILFVLEPYLFRLEFVGALSEENYCLIYWSFNGTITIIIAIILYANGNRIDGIKQISIMMVMNAILDLIRISQYPKALFILGIATMFSGIYICAYGLVVKRNMVYVKKASIFFLLIGPIYIIRFPFFADITLFYSLQRAFPVHLDKFYLTWNLIPNYLVIIIALLALDVLIREKQTVNEVKRRLGIQT
ncbi:MAG: hypothetical protein JXL85_02435 [Bacilli bacterium]|nr:hypothetical protein [Bacilli bacterium]